MSWTMDWTKENIKKLRLRMGWSHSDMARRLNIETELVLQFESGACCPEPQHEAYFALLAHHAEMASEEVHMAPLAETILDDENLHQIDRSSLLNKFDS